jgi:hypothetical protein
MSMSVHWRQSMERDEVWRGFVGDDARSLCHGQERAYTFDPPPPPYTWRCDRCASIYLQCHLLDAHGRLRVDAA